MRRAGAAPNDDEKVELSGGEGKTSRVSLGDVEAKMSAFSLGRTLSSVNPGAFLALQPRRA